MNKNIYQVVDVNVRKVMETGFSSREEAKTVRDKLNEDANSKTTDGSKPRFVVSRGTDHPLGATDGLDHTKQKNIWA